MTTPSKIAKTYFDAALDDARSQRLDRDATIRAFLSLVVSAYLENRSEEDVRQELLAAADNINPDEDYMFMRP